MAGAWDSKMKRLIAKSSQDFVTWLLKNATFIKELSPHLQGTGLDADILYLIEIDGEQYILHIEFQRSNDEDMPGRLWEYNMLAYRKYKIPVYSFVIYLKKGGDIADSPYVVQYHNGVVVHYFSFEVIKLWEIAAKTFLKSGLKGLLPLVPLTEGGKSREAVEEVINKLCPVGAPPERELLSLVYGLAALVFEKKDDQDWLRGRFQMLGEILSESWAFKELEQKAMERGMQKGIDKGIQQGMQQGLQQGMQQGLQQGMQQGMIEGERRILLSFVQTRFPELIPLAEECAAKIEDSTQLQDLTIKVGLAKDEQEAKVYLDNALQA